MKAIYIIILASFISMSSSVVVNKVVSIPCLPKYVRISNGIYDQRSAEAYARNCVHDGYIIKCFTVSNANYTIIAEKY